MSGENNKNLGDDIMLDYDNDIAFNQYGDIMFTSDVENGDFTIPFVGYIATREWLHDLIVTVIGSSTFDSNFGSNINYYLGRPFEIIKRVVSEELPSQILKDKRFRRVIEASTRVIADDRINIVLRVETVNNQQAQEFVFPFLNS